MFNKRNDTLIAELKEQRRVALTNFNAETLIKNEGLAEFFFTKLQTGEDVPFALLRQMPENETIPLPVVYGGWIVTVRRHIEKSDVIRYDTKWSAGSTITWHFHSDCNEKIVVKSGKVKVYSEGSVNVLLPGQTMEIGATIGHQVTALEDSELVIDFNKIQLKSTQ